jgi:peptide chain release factor
LPCHYLQNTEASMRDHMTECWIQVTAGQGPYECGLAVRNLSNCIMKEAKQKDLKADLIEVMPSNRSSTWASSLISIQGDNLGAFIAQWEGIVQWICESHFRPGHKRKNWFIGINILAPASKNQAHLKERDVVFQTMRASGPGGQHVNTTDSAVRATHMPTGMTVVAREERSQHMNKKLALARLALHFEEKHREAIASNIQEKWSKHHQLERGNPIKVFVGKEFKEKRMS